MKHYCLSNPAHRAYFDTGIAHKAVLVKGDEVQLCPTKGHCLSRKWKQNSAFTIPVDMWRKSRDSKDEDYEVESVTVCADTNCRRPIDIRSKNLINKFLGNTPVDEHRFMCNLDKLLEGL